MLGPMRSSLVFLAMLSASWGRSAKQGRDVTDYLSDLAGRQAKQCGVYSVGLGTAWEETQKSVLNCALAAARKPEPFYFIETGLSTDSAIAEGWVKTSKGDLLSYSYDSAPCGDPSCRESFTTRPCADPNLYMQGRWLKFRCDRPNSE